MSEHIISKVNIEGTEYNFADNSAVRFTEQTLTDEQKVQARENIGLNLVEPAEDDIPKVFFGSALPQTKDDTIMTFRYISKTEDISGYCKIKAQGSSSMSYPKKNQTVKLYNDAACTEKLKVDFKGWGKQSKFCWIDLTHARNIVTARLWGDVVKSRSNYTDIPELLRTSPNQGAIDGFPVKIYAGGVYQGRYTINIPKDAWMANMDDKLDNHCILCGESNADDRSLFRAESNISGNDWTDELHDKVPSSIKSNWNEAIRFIVNSTDDEFKAGIGNYFDVEGLLDYYLFGLVTCGLDAFGKNQLYMSYDGLKWYPTMYDLDSTWGLWWNGSRFVEHSYARNEFQDFADGNGNLLYIRVESLFVNEIHNRWRILRESALSIENILNRFERFIDIAPESLVEEDYANTTGEGSFTDIPSKTTNNIQQIRSFVLARRSWTDKYIDELLGVPCTGITVDSNSLIFTGSGTKTITATVEPANTTDSIIWVSSNPNVAYITVDNNVCTIRSVNNGTANVIVTCGTHSVTCVVEVSDIVDPDQYTIVSYVESDGSQHIDTNISGGTNAAYEIVFDPSSTVARNYEQYFGGDKTSIVPKFYNETSSSYASGARIASSTIVFTNGNTAFTVSNNSTLGQLVQVRYENPNSIYYNGTQIAGNNSSVENAGWGTLSWYIFANHGEGLRSSMRLYELKMYTNGEIVRYYIPVVRNSDGVVGLYDTVSNNFFISSTGNPLTTFTGQESEYRPSTSLPSGYEEIVISGNSDVSIPYYNDNPSGLYGTTHIKIAIPSASVVAPDILYNSGDISDAARAKSTAIYNVGSSNDNYYLVISLPSNIVGDTIDEVKTWLTEHNLVFYVESASA